MLWWLSYGGVVLVTCAGALLAYETIGEVVMIGLLLVTLLSQVLLLYLARVSRRWALIGALVLAAAIVPYHAYLGLRLLRVRAEAQRIADYAYTVRQQTGQFPASLAEYYYTDHRAKPFIQDYQLFERTGEFTVTFCVGTVNTSHWYSSRTGWGYYPD